MQKQSSSPTRPRQVSHPSDKDMLISLKRLDTDGDRFINSDGFRTPNGYEHSNQEATSQVNEAASVEVVE